MSLQGHGAKFWSKLFWFLNALISWNLSLSFLSTKEHVYPDFWKSLSCHVQKGQDGMDKVYLTNKFLSKISFSARIQCLLITLFCEIRGEKHRWWRCFVWIRIETTTMGPFRRFLTHLWLNTCINTVRHAKVWCVFSFS